MPILGTFEKIQIIILFSDTAFSVYGGLNFYRQGPDGERKGEEKRRGAGRGGGQGEAEEGGRC